MSAQAESIYEVTGNTKVFGILADPIRHVKTPQRLNEYFRQVGFDGILVPMHVHPDVLPSVVEGLRHVENFGGFVVTVPHKKAILPLCDSASTITQQIGAANVVRRTDEGAFVASMLDGKGFVSGLCEAGHNVAGRHVYMAGAGGAANALAFALVEAGAASLTIANRTTAKVDSIRSRLADTYPQANVYVGTPDPSGCDVIVNATSLGLRAGDPLPIDTSKLDATQLVCEIIMDPCETALLRAAIDKGCRVHYGAPMLAGQIRLMAEFLGIGVDAATVEQT